MHSDPTVPSRTPDRKERRSRSPRVTIVTIAALATLLLASCTATTNVPTVSVPTASPTASASRVSGGTLTIGTLFPLTGSASYLGPAEADGVDAAVRDINAAGGVLGSPVTVIHEDSGDASTQTIEASFATLRTKKTDVIIGPSSSVLAERLLPMTLAARIPMVSPSATSVRLTNLGDSGYFFRTVPSEADQGTVLAQSIGGGKGRIAIIYLNDQAGQAIKGTLSLALQKSGRALAATVPFAAATTDFAPLVAELKAALPDAVVFVSTFATMTQNAAVISQLDAAGLGGAKLWLTSQNMADYSQALPAGVLTNVNGILDGVAAGAAFDAKITAIDPTVSDFRYAAESYDATVLAALAAETAGDDAGSAITGHLRAVSEGGIICTNFAECLGVLKTSRDIDYDGLTGAISFDGQGNPSPAHYGVYRYDASNRFTRVGSVVGH